MEPSSWIGLVGALAVTLLAAYGSAVEAAVLAMRPSRLRELADGGNEAAASIRRLLEDRNRRAALTVSLSLVSAILAAALVTAVLAPELDRAGLAFPLAVVILTLLVAFVHIALVARLARRIGRRLDEGRTLAQARPWRLLLFIVAPLALLSDFITDRGLAAFGRGREAEEIGELGELREIIEASELEEAISEEDVDMIQGVLEISREQIRHIMTPRPDMVMVAAEMPAANALNLALEHGYSRLPVYAGDHDSIVGMVSVRQIAASLIDPTAGQQPVGELIQPAFFVPETKMVDDLLGELQAGRTHMAIAIDEYGDTAGLVTMEDIIERIVGDIRDETDQEPIEIIPDGDDAYLVDGRVRLGELAEQTGIKLEAVDADTLAGLVFLRLGHVPDDGEILDIDGIAIEVALVENNRIRRLRLSRDADQPEPGTPNPDGRQAA